jgi:hypothetical protein
MRTGSIGCSTRSSWVAKAPISSAAKAKPTMVLALAQPHAAPAHHFGDTNGLLTSLAVEGLGRLHAHTAAAAESVDDPVDRLVPVGRAHVEVATRYPADCEVLFRGDLVDTECLEYQAGGLDAFGVLVGTVQSLADELNPPLAVDDASRLCWVSMQGLVVLQANMARMDEATDRAPLCRDELVERFTRLLVEGFRAR